MEIAYKFEYYGNKEGLDIENKEYRYYSLKLIEVKEKWDTNDTFRPTILNQRTPLNTEKCNKSRLDDNPSLKAGLLSFEEYYCLDRDYTIELQGDASSNEISYYNLILNPCSAHTLMLHGFPNETCASNDDIEEVLHNSALSLLVIDQYFNDTDFSSNEIGPIWKKPKVYSFNFDEQMAFMQTIRIKKETAVLKDNWFSESFTETEYDFYTHQLDQIQVGSLVQNKYDMLNIVIFRDFQEIQHERTVSTFITLLSDTGGFAGTITLIIGTLIASSQESSYLSSVLASLFMYQKNLLKSQKVKSQKEI